MRRGPPFHRRLAHPPRRRTVGGLPALPSLPFLPGPMAAMGAAYQGAMAIAAPQESYVGSPTAARLSLLQVGWDGPCDWNLFRMLICLYHR